MKRIVVIGGGFAGSHIAKDLEKDFEVILIDTKEYFEFTPGVLRTIVDSKKVRKIEVKHSHYLHRTKIVVGCVSEVRDNSVTVKLKGNDNSKITKIKFDYLAICSGSSYNKPIKEQDEIIASVRADKLRENSENLRKSKNIIVVGGGLVGVELCGEISTFHKDKNIYLIHSHNELIERHCKKSKSYAKKFLKDAGVKILLNEKFERFNNNKAILKSGKKIDANLVFLTIGIKPNFEFMKKNFSKSLDKKGFLIVNKNLQLMGNKNIFVAGDITSINEEKLAQNAEKQAEIVSKNIILSENNDKLCAYKSRDRIKVISLGKWNGILEYKKFVFTGFIPGILKNVIEIKEMMIKKEIILN